MILGFRRTRTTRSLAPHKGRVHKTRASRLSKPASRPFKPTVWQFYCPECEWRHLTNLGWPEAMRIAVVHYHATGGISRYIATTQEKAGDRRG